MPAALLNLQYSYSICLFLYLQDVRRGTRRATRAGRDVAGMDLLGHLDSQGPDSEVLPGPVARPGGLAVVLVLIGRPHCLPVSTSTTAA